MAIFQFRTHWIWEEYYHIPNAKKPIIHHCEDLSLTKDGEMNEGEVSTRLGILGMPSIAETIILERDLQLVKLTGAKYHASHISCKSSVNQ